MFFRKQSIYIFGRIPKCLQTTFLRWNMEYLNSYLGDRCVWEKIPQVISVIDRERSQIQIQCSEYSERPILISWQNTILKSKGNLSAPV